jgi:hypothetical protein
MLDEMNVHRYKINFPFVKEDLIRKIYENTGLFYHNLSYEYPGIQTELILKCKEIDYILNFGVEKCKELFYKDKNIENVDYCIYPWVFILRNDTTQAHFHNHTEFSKATKSSVISDYTFTYYAQMPNNLEKKDGRLGFLYNEQNVLILPEEDELFVFPAKLYHRPETSINSDKDRIVIAANVLFTIPTLKNKKTLM